MLVSLSGSFQTAPAFWLDPKNGVVYSVAVQTPQYRATSLDALLNTPVSAAQSGLTQQLSNVVQVAPDRQLAVVSHYNITPVVDVYASVEGRDLGSVSNQVQQLVDDMRPRLARGHHLPYPGQWRPFRSWLSDL